MLEHWLVSLLHSMSLHGISCLGMSSHAVAVAALCVLPPWLQTCLTSLNLDSRTVGDACLSLLLPLGQSLLDLDLTGACITPKGTAMLAAAFTALQKLDLCGGHITGAVLVVCSCAAL